VTNPSGSVGRTPINDLVDAYSQVSGVDWQHQLYSVLTNKPDACAHYRQNQVVANEKWLIIVQIAYRSDRQPAPFATGTYQIGVGVTDPGRHPSDSGCDPSAARSQLFGRRPAASYRRHGHLHHRHRHTGRGQLRPPLSQQHYPGRLLRADVFAVCPRPSRTCLEQ
jgi:hypothetical protein